MSVAFRVFLLIVFGFGAIWVYRFRSQDVSEWLRPLPPLAGQNDLRDPLTSPVDELVGPELELARVRIAGRPAAREAGVAPDGVFPEGGFQTEGGERGALMSAEEESHVADLPLEEDGDHGADGADLVALDELDPSGAAPADVPPGRSPRPGEGGSPVPAPVVPPRGPIAYEEFVHEVKEGESLWKISEALLGSGLRHGEIGELNKDLLAGRDPARIPVGTKLRIRRPLRQDPVRAGSPLQEILDRGATGGTGQPRDRGQEGLKKPPAQTDTSVEGTSAPVATRSTAGWTPHTVQRNENLQKIARRYYPGDAEGWRAIFEANRHVLTSADRVVEGQILRIPEARARAVSRR